MNKLQDLAKKTLPKDFVIIEEAGYFYVENVNEVGIPYVTAETPIQAVAMFIREFPDLTIKGE